MGGRSAVFIKCNECKIKPATTRCFDCKSYGQSIARFCYACDSAIHNKFGQTPHKREIIPYKGKPLPFYQPLPVSSSLIIAFFLLP